MIVVGQVYQDRREKKLGGQRTITILDATLDRRGRVVVLSHDPKMETKRKIKAVADRLEDASEYVLISSPTAAEMEKADSI